MSGKVDRLCLVVRAVIMSDILETNNVFQRSLTLYDKYVDT